MKKPLAIILAFFIVFSPVYSYAVLPALAASAASAAGRVLVGNSVKKVSQSALARAGMAVVGACKQNPLSCIGIGVGIAQLLDQDGWSIDIGGDGDTTNNNINVEIYKIPDGTCFKYKDDSPFLPKNVSYPSISDLCKSLIGQDYGSNGRIASSKHVNGCSSHIVDKDSSNTIHSNLNLYVYQQTSCSSKQYITYNEFNTYLTKNLTNNQAGDIIKNIYNYDYSQHPNITINNNTTSGSDINNDLSISADPELNVTPRLKLDIENNKVNLDNVNDENCTKNEAGEYDNCTGEPDPEEEETDPDDPNNPSPEEPPPIECSANGFYKKICDWMDWTKENPTPSEEAPVDIKNIEAENTNKIDMAGECPAPYELNFTIAGYAQNNSISYEPLCGALEMLKPIFIGSGALSGMFILMGYSRPSGTGAN